MSMELVKTEPSHPDKDDQEPKIPDTLPVLPLPETVVFPYMIAPLFVNRERSIKAVDQSLAENRMMRPTNRPYRCSAFSRLRRRACSERSVR